MDYLFRPDSNFLQDNSIYRSMEIVWIILIPLSYNEIDSLIFICDFIYV